MRYSQNSGLQSPLMTDQHSWHRALFGTTAIALAMGVATLYPMSARASDRPTQPVLFDGSALMSLQKIGAEPPRPEYGQGNNGEAVDGWSITQSGAAATLTADGPIVSVLVQGGRGSDAGSGIDDPGGAGGWTGDINYTELTGQEHYFSNTGTGDVFLFTSKGGNGGLGSTPGDRGQGGTGGVAGLAGDITISVGIKAYTQLTVTNGAALKVSSAGGTGGESGQTVIDSFGVTGTAGTQGSDGGTVQIDFGGQIRTADGGTSFGIQALSAGGDGGAGGLGFGGTVKGGNGGAGGNGGDVTVAQHEYSSIFINNQAQMAPVAAGNDTLQAISATAAIEAVSQGGLGGLGATADGGSATAGTGGAAGHGGTVTVTLEAHGLSAGDPNVGIAIQTTGDFAYGVSAASIGGAGGDTVAVGGISKHGGNGGIGGDGGLVSIVLDRSNWEEPYGYTVVSTEGRHSDAVIGQSIGGGGGAGGDVNVVGLADVSGIGGSGANGGAGGTVSIVNQQGYVIRTEGHGARAILAQSIGGGGGRGGSAIVESLDNLNIIGGSPDATGGNGGSGGNAGSVSVTNTGLIQTEGHHASGILSQSIGGGGGVGGAAFSASAGTLFTQSFAVGGYGGPGGDGGDISTINNGQVITAGSQAHALHSQSVGGGGGVGGAARADSISLNLPDLPSATLTTAIGGRGGLGGDGGNVTQLNAAMVVTSGRSAHAMFSQSIGGGGGSGGDATGTDTAIVQSKFVLDLMIGGAGGDGGAGGNVGVANSGLVMTLGDGSHAVFGQSVGGGGGDGGDARINQGAYEAPGDYSGNIVLSLGGRGGGGGRGGDVSVDNDINDYNFPNSGLNGSGGLMTMGHSAVGLFAQSVGGGGGNAGQATSLGGNGQLSLNVALGGSGGVGGDGGSVVVSNLLGAIATYGADSPAIFAQSIGGGGGKGGNATTGSGNDPQYYYPEFLFNILAPKVGAYVEPVLDKMWDWKDNVMGDWSDLTRIDELYRNYQAVNPTTPPAETKNLSITDLTVDIGAGRAGIGGAGGNGGGVQVSNAGSIRTYGPGSTAIFAQSVGGGGGSGGASTSATANDQTPVAVLQGSISLGGASGSGGSGGTVGLYNAGAINTYGDLAHGMFGQSIGGGGGIGGASSSVSGFSPFRVSLGGKDSAHGNGGEVDIANYDAIVTQGDDAIGMLGQSVGGGGGYVTLTGQTIPDKGARSVSKSQTIAQGSAQLQFMNGSAGNGGAVNVTLRPQDEDPNSGGWIYTSGVNSHGILAQSVGGGGGLMLADANNGATNNRCGAGGGLYYTTCTNDPIQRADGGAVTVQLADQHSSIKTTGDGAAGIFAQSIGGGGGIVNGLNGINLSYHPNVPTPYESSGVSGSTAGNAGHVKIDNNGTIITEGAYAHGIFAMAAANGGGVIGRADGTGLLFFGVTSLDQVCDSQGENCGGDVEIGFGSQGYTKVSGANAYGVVALALGAGANYKKAKASVTMMLLAGSQIIAEGDAAGAIHIGGSTGAIIFNSGTIDGSQSSQGIAVDARIIPYSSATNYLLLNLPGGVVKGSIVGNMSLSPFAVDFENRGGAVFEAGATVDLGTGALTNAGILRIGSAGRVSKTIMIGDFIQQDGGALHLDADMKSGSADGLEVTGKVALSGAVHVTPSTVSNRSIRVLSATEGVTLDRTLVMTDSSALFDFPVTVVGNELHLKAEARFNQAAANLGARQKAVAGNLQLLFEGGSAMDDGFTALSRLQDGEAVAKGLDTLGGQALGAIGAFRYASSRAFVGNLYDGCEPLDGGNDMTCSWARFVAGNATQDATTDELGYEARAETYQMGLQTEIREGLYLSAAAAYQHGRFNDADHRSRISGDSLLLGSGLRYHQGGWMISGAVDWAYSWYDSRRTLTIADSSATARAKPRGWQVGAHAHTAYSIEKGSATIRPFADLHAIYVRANGFVESGASPFNLDVASQGELALIGGAGVEFDGRIPLGKGATLRPFASAALVLNGASGWTTSARFAGQSMADRFLVTTAAPDYLGRFAIGADILGSKKVDFSASYSPEIGRAYRSHVVAARLTYRF